MRRFKALIITLSLLVLILIVSCKKYVEVEVPGNIITADNVYNNDVTAISVLNSLYSQLSSSTYNNSASIPTISLWAGLSADEFSLWPSSSSSRLIAYYQNNLSDITAGGDFWMNIYPLIYSCNAAIEGLQKSESLTPSVKDQLLGEAMFLRGFFYFYLVNFYGDIPLAYTTDHTINSVLMRTTPQVVYEKIITDLLEAQNLLADGYVTSDAKTLYTNSIERIRPSKAAATALLARVYLYTEKWASAESEATAVISNNQYFGTVSLNNVFLKNSRETIWQLQPVLTGSITNTAEASFFVLTNNPPDGLNDDHPVHLSDTLLNSFEPGDERRTNGNWVNEYTDVTGTYYYPYKFKDITQGTGIIPSEYIMILRLGEQYLIRAEARAQQNKIAGSQDDLNVIRTRAGLANTIASDKESLLTAILQERRVELFSELGHRWFDLKRRGKIESVMNSVTPKKGGIWSSYKQFYPVARDEITKNPKLLQTPGY